MLWDHCKVSRKKHHPHSIKCPVCGPAQFCSLHLLTWSMRRWGHWVYLKNPKSTLCLAPSGTSCGTHRDVFLVMLTKGILMSDEAGGPPHFPHRWASSRTGLRAPRVHCLELIRFSIKPWTTNRVTGLSSKIEKSIAHALAAGLASGSSVDAQGCKLSRLPVC